MDSVTDEGVVSRSQPKFAAVCGTVLKRDNGIGRGKEKKLNTEANCQHWWKCQSAGKTSQAVCLKCGRVAEFLTLSPCKNVGCVDYRLFSNEQRICKTTPPVSKNQPTQL